MTELADTYAADAGTIREHTFRRDMLVPFFRPNPVLGWLGVPMPMISNDQHLPRLGTSLGAAWLGENVEITDAGLTFVALRTSPKRLGVRDDVSWMLLAAADAQLGIQPIITMEMARAVGQAKEAAVFAGSGANVPGGINGTTGITAIAITSDTPTYRDMLELKVQIAEEHIPVESMRGVLTPAASADLATTLRFAATNFSRNNTPLFISGGEGLGDSLPMMGMVAGTIPAIESTNLPTDLTSNNDEHLLLAGVWQYVVCFDYSVAFLTIDDVSAAATGETRITVNSYHDVAVRLPKAFSKAQWNPSA